MRPEGEIQARIDELEGLVKEAREGYLATGNTQMLLLCPVYQAGREELRWALGGGEE